MHSQPAHPASYPPQPARRWWQRPAVIIIALVLLPPLGIALAWMTRWTQGKKIVATVLSGLWFLIVLLSDGGDKAADDAKAEAAPTAAAPGKTVSPSTPAALPAVVSMPFDKAEKALKDAGVAKVTALSAYLDVPLSSYHSTWSVCFQSPEAGAASADTTLHLVSPGGTCPAAPGTRRYAEVTQTPAPPKAEETSGTGGGGSAHYKNCAAAKAAGAAPIRKGQPGYRSALDKDGDGIACDK